MFTTLTVKNFQIHKNLTVEFKPGLNVITGPTNSGKSALIRALNLLIMNQPRNAEKLFQNQNSEGKLEIILKDDEGNTIQRKDRKYHINDVQIKAFGSDIPKPIMELLPFFDVNWQRQLDQHFLILQTGGTSAKYLNNITGMEDQEKMLQELKLLSAEYKGNIKRLIKNNADHSEKLSELKFATRLFMVAKSIQNQYDKLNEDYQKHQSLNNLINQIKECPIDFNYKLFNSLVNKMNDIKILINKMDKLFERVDVLQTLCDQLNDVESMVKKDTKIYNDLLNRVKNIHEIIQTKIDIVQSIDYLSSIIASLENSSDKYEAQTTLAKDLQITFQDKLIEIGECPLCGSSF